MRTNKVTDFLNSVAVRIFLLIILTTLVAALPRIATASAVVAAPVCEAGAHQVTGQCVADVLPAAEGTEAQDAEAEGQDVLPLSWHAAPADLWAALPDKWYDGDVPDGIGTVWVPVGTVVDVPGGLYLATLDGWAGCQDWVTSDAECSATGPVEMLDIQPVPATVVYGAGAGAQCGTDGQCAALDADRELAGLPALDGPAYGTEDGTAQVQTVAYTTSAADAPATFSRQCVTAAKSILWAHRVGIRVEEDLSYRGMPDRVADCNDDLAAAFYADGHDFTGQHGKALRTFLRHVVKTGQAPQVQMPGKVRAEDGSLVPHSFYDATDYNRDGITDQEQGCPRNPRPADVKVGGCK